MSSTDAAYLCFVTAVILAVTIFTFGSYKVLGIDSLKISKIRCRYTQFSHYEASRSSHFLLLLSVVQAFCLSSEISGIASSTWASTEFRSTSRLQTPKWWHWRWAIFFLALLLFVVLNSGGHFLTTISLNCTNFGDSHPATWPSYTWDQI